jgi:hypothetical protein
MVIFITVPFFKCPSPGQLQVTALQIFLYQNVLAFQSLQEENEVPKIIERECQTDEVSMSVAGAEIQSSDSSVQTEEHRSIPQVVGCSIDNLPLIIQKTFQSSWNLCRGFSGDKYKDYFEDTGFIFHLADERNEPIGSIEN